MLQATSSLKGTTLVSVVILVAERDIKVVCCKGTAFALLFRYYAAAEAKKERTSKHAQSFGTKNTSQNTSASQVVPFLYFVLPHCLFDFPLATSLFVFIPPGSSGVAHPPALPLPAAADPGGCVYLLSDAL